MTKERDPRDAQPFTSDSLNQDSIPSRCGNSGNTGGGGNSRCSIENPAEITLLVTEIEKNISE